MGGKDIRMGAKFNAKLEILGQNGDSVGQRTRGLIHGNSRTERILIKVTRYTYLCVSRRDIRMIFTLVALDFL
jgi:hypothetical protein